jgi:hypothetical protein
MLQNMQQRLLLLLLLLRQHSMQELLVVLRLLCQGLWQPPEVCCMHLCGIQATDLHASYRYRRCSTHLHQRAHVLVDWGL